MLKKGALAARALWPTRSLVAGSAAATFDLRCLLVRCIREHIRAHSRVDLCIHIDDLTQAGTELDDHDTIELVAASAESLAARVEELGLVLADPKLRLLGSSPSLVERAMARLEALGGRRAEEHPHLGTVFCVLQRRRGAGQAVRRARLRQFVVRSDRLVNLLRGVRSRTEAAKAWAVQRVGQVAAAPLRIWRRLRGKQAPPEASGLSAHEAAGVDQGDAGADAPLAREEQVSSPPLSPCRGGYGSDHPPRPPCSVLTTGQPLGGAPLGPEGEAADTVRRHPRASSAGVAAPGDVSATREEGEGVGTADRKAYRGPRQLGVGQSPEGRDGVGGGMGPRVPYPPCEAAPSLLLTPGLQPNSTNSDS